jgi:hypothetical protein
MNEEERGWCCTDRSCFNIPVDEEGNNIVTGENNQDYLGNKYFTCIDLEVFSVVYDIHPYQDPSFERYLQKQKEATQRNQEFRKALE